MKNIRRISAVVGCISPFLFATAFAADIMPQNPSEAALYLAVSGGWSHLERADLSNIPGVGTGEIFFYDGWTGAVMAGKRLSNHWRAEVEIAAHRQGLNYENLSGFGRQDLAGNVQVYDGLAKLAYDFGEGPLRPYVAAGIGVANFGVDLQSPQVGSDNDWAMAGALEAGLSYAISPQVELFASGQVLVLGDVTLDPTSAGSGATVSHPTLLSSSVGLRFNF